MPLTGARLRRPAHRGCRGGRKVRRAKARQSGEQLTAPDVGVHPCRVDRPPTPTEDLPSDPDNRPSNHPALSEPGRDSPAAGGATPASVSKTRPGLEPAVTDTRRQTRPAPLTRDQNSGIPPAAGSAGPARPQSQGAARPSEPRAAPRQTGRQRGNNSHGGQTTDVTGELLMCTINIQSIKPKILELHQEIEQHQFDVIAVTETWLKPNTPTRLLNFPGFTVIRADRPDKSGYGGVAVIHRDGVQASTIATPHVTDTTSKIETLWTIIKPGHRGHQFVLATVYRPPRRTVAAIEADFATLEAQLQHVLLKFPGAKVIITGDFNCNLLGDVDAPRKMFELFLSSYSLSQHIKSPTYTTGSLLDVVVTNDPQLVSKASTILCHFSPHRFLVSSLSIPRFRPKPVVVESRSLKRVNELVFCECLRNADWQQVYRQPTTSGQWQCFLEIFVPLLDLFAPVKQIKIRNPTAPPVSDATLHIMRQRRAALDSGGHSEEYRALNRSVRSAIRRDARQEISRRLTEDGPQSVYRNVRQHIGSSKKARTSPAISADSLNEYFVGVGPRVANEVAQRGDIPDDFICRLPRVGTCKFTVETVDMDTLISVISEMKNSSACGTDGISIRALKLGLDVICVPLLNIVNTCLASNDFPNVWKHSIVHPIHKSGPLSDPANFRPISIVPVIAKIVERIVQRQLYSYLTQNHLFSPAQHGFRPRHSTETALITVTDHILSATDRGEISLLCLLDLSKCFDVIDHSKLLTKLQLHGVDAGWFRSYLSNHTQSVSITDHTGRRCLSKPLQNNIGVFQGSSLGPLLYSIFANDLSYSAPDALVVQYADDTQIIVSGVKSDLGSVVARMEHALACLDTWFLANSLKVNAAKTQLMMFGSRQNLRTVPPIVINFRGETLGTELSVRNLGVMFDPVLSWDDHVAHLTRKCYGFLIGLSHIRHYIPHHILFTLVQGLIISHIRYCISVFGNCSDKNHKQLQKIINFSARVVSGKRKYDHISDVLKGPGWLNSKQLAHYHCLTLAHSIQKNGEPSSLTSMFKLNSDMRARHTRQDRMQHLPKFRTETGRRQFAYRAPHLYNSLPPVVTCLKAAPFKKAVKNRLKVVV